MLLQQLNILLADDDIDDCHFFKEVLETLRVATRLITVHDGEELMNYLEDNLVCLPDIIFLDTNMPRKNGFECLSEIKNHEKLKNLPVIMFSTSQAPHEINILFKTGADIYIRKPSSFSQLVQVIHHALPMATENIFSSGQVKYILNA